MPSVFKALVSITVWILFVFGLLTLVAAFGRLAMSGSNAPTPFLMTAYFGFGVASLFLSVVAAKIRKTLE